MFFQTYQKKRVLITGHTGFKGSWLTTWLLKLGAHVIGVSKDIPTQPSMFNELKLSEKITHIQADVRNLEGLQKIITDEKPDFVFHLAAQAIVSASKTNPVETMSTNIIGTMNLLEILRQIPWPCTAVLITSDKCYDNVEWVWGYRETDALGGKDIYSGSKGAAELVIKSYAHTFFQNNHPVRLAVGRAGNVIGGGDWAKDRIVVDCMKAWSQQQTVEIRSPKATRPWQHVLEPLSGYLLLGAGLLRQSPLHKEAFNFGPRAEQNRTVIELLSDLAQRWGFNHLEKAYRIINDTPFHEANLLKLNCDKALSLLKWEANLNYDEMIRLVADWYTSFYHKKSDMYGVTLEQINLYERLATERHRQWTLQESSLPN